MTDPKWQRGRSRGGVTVAPRRRKPRSRHARGSKQHRGSQACQQSDDGELLSEVAEQPYRTTRHVLNCPIRGSDVAAGCGEVRQDCNCKAVAPPLPIPPSPCMRGGTSTQRKNIVRRWTVAADVRTKREPNNIALAVLFGPPTSCQFCRSSPSVLHYIAIANVVIIVVRGRGQPQYHMPPSI